MQPTPSTIDSITSLLPRDWNPKLAGDVVLRRLVPVTVPCVKGAHDSDFVAVDGRAYVVYMANDVLLGEQPDWPFVYIVNPGARFFVRRLASGRLLLINFRG